MSDRYFETLRRSHIGNCIPSGRQLPRTPPMTNVKKQLDFCDPDVDFDKPQQSTEASTRGQSGCGQNGTLDRSYLETNTDTPHSMLKGMKGYQLTASDLDFIKKMKEEQLIKKLEGDLKEVQILLKNERMALELVHTSREMAQAELNKLPSCEELTEWLKVVLKRTSPLMEFTDMNVKSLLAMVTMENVKSAMDEKKKEITRIKKILARKREEEAEEKGKLEQQIAIEKMKIQGLMNQLVDLKYELSKQDETYKSLAVQMNTQKVPQDHLKQLQVTKSKVKHERSKKNITLPENLSDTTVKEKSARRKQADHRISVTDDHPEKSSSEPLTKLTEDVKKDSGAASQKPTRPVKAARRKQRVEEQELRSKESVPAAGGRQKSAGTAQTTASEAKNPRKVNAAKDHATSQQVVAKNQRKVNAAKDHSTSQQVVASRSRKKSAVAADDAREEASNTALRRSKRIANKR